jgi:hypothetical protein
VGGAAGGPRRRPRLTATPWRAGIPEPAPGKPFRLRVGTRPLDPDDWLIVDDDYERDLALKAELLATRHAACVVTLPGTEDAAQEVYDEARRVVGDRAPTPPAVLHPIDRAGRIVQEDLCLHTVVEGSLVLSAASVCFPNRWDVREKLGRPVQAIHGPVPGYDRDLARPVDTLLGRLRPERGLTRSNWALLPDPTLHQPEGRDPPRGFDPAGLWFRLERQTLRRLPVHGSVLFTIRTLQWPLPEVAADRPAAEALADAVAALPPALARYKDLEACRDSIVDWLRTSRPAPTAG